MLWSDKHIWHMYNGTKTLFLDKFRSICLALQLVVFFSIKDSSSKEAPNRNDNTMGLYFQLESAFNNSALILSSL